MIVDVSEVKSIYICSKKVDFRKQINGLVTFIEFELGQVGDKRWSKILKICLKKS